MYIKRYIYDVGLLKKFFCLVYLLVYGIGYVVYNVFIVEYDIKELWNIIIFMCWEN